MRRASAESTNVVGGGVRGGDIIARNDRPISSPIQIPKFLYGASIRFFLFTWAFKLSDYGVEFRVEISRSAVGVIG